jgi:hypothetical protein
MKRRNPKYRPEVKQFNGKKENSETVSLPFSVAMLNRRLKIGNGIFRAANLTCTKSDLARTVLCYSTRCNHHYKDKIHT